MPRPFRPLLSLALWLAVLASPVAAQDAASLIADSVSINGDSVLVAEGNVEVLYQGRRLTAGRIVYDKAGDSLTIDGPIVLREGEGSFILADQAALSADLENGVLTSARLVLNQQLQLAASELSRVGGRYTSLGRTVASSCQVCAGNPTPLWEIRARRVVHDQLERQIYFDRATLRFAGVPVFYVPRLRLPDPTLKRTSGLLRPSIRTTSGLGAGIKLPYFLTLGVSRDLTLTPYVTAKGGRSLDLRYREAFSFGSIEVNGARSRDELLPDDSRGYIFAQGVFILPRDFDLRFQFEEVSDSAYYYDYGMEEKDRLDSRIEITRTRRNEFIGARIINFRTLREDEDNDTLPSVIGDMVFHRRFSGGPLGGQGGLSFETHSHHRSSSADIDSDLDGDLIADGRDMSRVSVGIDWRRNWVLPGGLVGATLGEAQADLYRIDDDETFGGSTTRLHAAGAVELRWPWVRGSASGAQHVIEPVAQLVWSREHDDDLPNEDSALVEFDEGNLFSLTRFPGSDAVEEGRRLNLGVSWTRYDPDGWSLGATVGRVIRQDDLDQFGNASGLDGSSSDWLAAVQVSLASGLTATNRVLIDDSFEITKAEWRLDLARENYGLSSSYVRVLADPSESREDNISELRMDGRYGLTDFWTAKATGRYDFEADRLQRAGLGMEFRNECLKLDLSLSRRFASSTSVSPDTDFGLSVDLLGFGSGAEAGPSRVCRR
ncbi:LPS-assembly protein LptD [Cereibacter changlensis]|uniref:LPS-assembly protein LptD n=1 Tax=Cereibacter changlensis TaxID=402884 RepID=A0A4V5NLN2_9RHOB|nr:LPS assembly protein LptD [Cereibacter changlensis]TKA96357.1 LPS-assembly protein LptD [Cereibacter changlensis]